MFIREYNGHKYRIYTTNNNTVIIAVSTFGRKPVRGIAKCDPQDTPNLETGIMLAIHRCNLKICKKRLARANEVFAVYEEIMRNATQEYSDAIEYRKSARKEYDEANMDMMRFMESIK